MTKKNIFWVIWAGIAAYFLYLAWGGAQAHWALDDPMNLGVYWARGLGVSLWDNLKFWGTAYRPMGAVFYLPLYHFFGLNPMPFRIVALMMIGADIYFSFWIAEWLTRSRAVAVLTAILVVAHGTMVPIYQLTSMIYDVMAFFFTALMLFLYLRVRAQGRELSFWQGLGVVAAYVAALNSKEIAVVGAGWVLAYELLCQKKWKLATPAVLMLCGLVYTAGRLFGPHALAQQDGYQLEKTWHRFFVNNKLYLNSLFYGHYLTSSRQWVLLWVVLAVVCVIARKRALWWAWFAALTATLPTSLVVVPRSGASLYLPLLAFAVLVSILAVGFFKDERLKWGAVAVVGALAVRETLVDWKSSVDGFTAMSAKTWSTMERLKAVGARPRPHGRVVILNDPFIGWDAYFIAELMWNDPTVQIILARETPDQARDLNSFDWVLQFDGDRLNVVRRR